MSVLDKRSDMLTIDTKIGCSFDYNSTKQISISQISMEYSDVVATSCLVLNCTKAVCENMCMGGGLPAPLMESPLKWSPPFPVNQYLC